MLNNIAVLTTLFDYPLTYQPSFYQQSVKYFDAKNIHICRYNNHINNSSYYDKLYYYKIVKTLEYITNYIVNIYDYILYLDATDTNFLSSPNDIIGIFKKHTCSIIMGAEKGLWPNTSYTNLYENKPILSDYKYLNSGTYFGYTTEIIKHLQQIVTNQYQKGIDDQGHWTIQYLLSQDIVIDQKQEIFFSTYQSKNNIIINNNQITLKNSSAFIIHDNGGHDDHTIKLTDNINENY